MASKPRQPAPGTSISAQACVVSARLGRPRPGRRSPRRSAPGSPSRAPARRSRCAKSWQTPPPRFTNVRERRVHDRAARARTRSALVAPVHRRDGVLEQRPASRRRPARRGLPASRGPAPRRSGAAGTRGAKDRRRARRASHGRSAGAASAAKSNGFSSCVSTTSAEACASSASCGAITLPRSTRFPKLSTCSRSSASGATVTSQRSTRSASPPCGARRSSKWCSRTGSGKRSAALVLDQVAQAAASPRWASKYSRWSAPWRSETPSRKRSRNSWRPLLEERAAGLRSEQVARAAIAAAEGESARAEPIDVERLRHAVDGEAERAREVAVEDHELRDVLGQQRGVAAPVRLEARHRLQERRPLVVVERRADEREVGQQQVVLHVHDARGHVRALEEEAEQVEAERLAAHHRARRCGRGSGRPRCAGSGSGRRRARARAAARAAPGGAGRGRSRTPTSRARCGRAPRARSRARGAGSCARSPGWRARAAGTGSRARS